MANMKRNRMLVVALLSLCASGAFAHDRNGDAIIGAAVGGIFGSVIGSQMGGRDGAIVGAGLGAFTGAAITSQGHDERGYVRYSGERGYDHYRDRGRYEERGYRRGHHGYYRERDNDDWGHGYEGRHGHYR